jgi:membrane-bound lytic murein transglycosylase MltF
MTSRFIRRLCIYSLVFLGLSSAASAEPTIVALPGVKSWSGDLDAMIKRRVVRILVPPSRTLFFIHKGEVTGATAEFGLLFEKWLNSRYGKKGLTINVAFVPTGRERLLSDLRAGKGDIAAGNLTITEERAAAVDFAPPWATGVREVLVTGPSAANISSLEDLSGREVTVRASSSYFTHLQRLNERLKAENKKAISILPADENLEDEDLLEMVSAGLLPWTIVDSHKANLWSKLLKGLKLRDDIAINADGQIAWAIRKDSPQLKKELAAFVERHKVGTSVGSDIRLRYFTDGRTVRNALSTRDAGRLKGNLDYFRAYGLQYGIDPFLLAAQGYQESRLDQSLRVKSGAVGVMQIKPSTAREKEIAITDVTSRAEDNIHAGAKYMRFLTDRYIADLPAADVNRVLMALAAYNAGPGALRKFREQARKQGYDPNVWFKNVEYAAAAAGRYETVQYIGNIYKYYVAYSRLLGAQAAQAASAKP